jgi:hypothetical protein
MRRLLRCSRLSTSELGPKILDLEREAVRESGKRAGERAETTRFLPVIEIQSPGELAEHWRSLSYKRRFNSGEEKGKEEGPDFLAGKEAVQMIVVVRGLD